MCHVVGALIQLVRFPVALLEGVGLCYYRTNIMVALYPALRG